MCLHCDIRVENSGQSFSLGSVTCTWWYLQQPQFLSKQMFSYIVLPVVEFIKESLVGGSFISCYSIACLVLKQSPSPSWSTSPLACVCSYCSSYSSNGTSSLFGSAKMSSSWCDSFSVVVRVDVSVVGFSSVLLSCRLMGSPLWSYNMIPVVGSSVFC